MEQVERTQQQQTALQRQSAFPFIQLHARSAPQHSQQQPEAAASVPRPHVTSAESGVAVSGEPPAQQAWPTTTALSSTLPPSAPAASSHTAARPSPPPPPPHPHSNSHTLLAAAHSAPASSSKTLTHLLLLCCEVLSSERTYVLRLDELIAGYVLPLKSKHAQLGVSRDDVDVLFSCVEVIGSLHHRILEHLQRQAQAMSSSAAGQQAVSLQLLDGCVANIAACFEQFAAYLKLYVQYVNQYNAGMETLKRLADNKRFVKFVGAVPLRAKAAQQSQQQAAATAGSGASPLFELQSLLILPIQRIPRYELFLVSIAKQVDDSFGCRSQLSSALLLVQRLASLINESKRQAEAGVKMNELRGRVKGLSATQPLLAPHRRLLREDAVVQLLPKRREYVLVTFNDGVMLLSHAYRLKGFYTADADIAAVRHYQPKAAHAAATQARSEQSSSQADEARQQQQQDELEADSDAEGEDDSEYPSCVEIELRKGRAEADGAGVASTVASGGQAGARLKRFSLAFTAAVASLTDANTLVLQFAAEADKQAWAADWAKHAHHSAQTHSLSGMLQAISADTAPSSQPTSSLVNDSGPSSSSVSALSSSPLGSDSAQLPPSALPPSLPSLPLSARPVFPPAFGGLPAHLPAGAVPVLPARPRPAQAKPPHSDSRDTPPAPATATHTVTRAAVAAAKSAPPSGRAEWQPFSYTQAATTAHSAPPRTAKRGDSTTEAADRRQDSSSGGSAQQSHSQPPPLLSAFQRSQQHEASPVDKQPHDAVGPTRFAAHNKENRQWPMAA